MRMAGIKVKDFFTFIKANENLDNLYVFAKRYEKIHNKIFCYFRASHAAGVHVVLHRAVYHGHWAFVYEVHRHYERKVGRA